MQFNDVLISRLEGLAKLKFAAKERNKIREDLEKIIKMINTLEQVNTNGIDPLVYLNDTSDTTRKDEISDQLSKKEALANAPQKNADFITIPKVIDL